MSAEALPHAIPRLRISSHFTPQPGELPTSTEWEQAAQTLDAFAKRLVQRFASRKPFDAALAQFVAREVAGAAAEIRANLALEEMTACQNRR